MIDSDVGPFALVPLWVARAASASALRVYIELANMADRTTQQAWPSRRSMAERCGFSSVRTVDNAVAELVELGALVKHQRPRSGERHDTTLYTVVMRQPGCTVVHPPVQRGAQGEGAAASRERVHADAPKPKPGNQNQDLAPAQQAAPPRELWDALVNLLGYAPQTDRERSAWNGAIRSMRMAGATVELLQGRVSAYRKRWPELDVTPPALARHWGRLDPFSRTVPSKPTAAQDREQATRWLASDVGRQVTEGMDADDVLATLHDHWPQLDTAELRAIIDREGVPA